MTITLRLFKNFFLTCLLRRLWCQLPSVAEVLNDNMLLCEWLLCSEHVHLHAAGGHQPFPVTGTCDRRQNEAVQSVWPQPVLWKAADGHPSSHCSWSSKDHLRENRFLPGVNFVFLFYTAPLRMGWESKCYLHGCLGAARLCYNDTLLVFASTAIWKQLHSSLCASQQDVQKWQVIFKLLVGFVPKFLGARYSWFLTWRIWFH